CIAAVLTAHGWALLSGKWCGEMPLMAENVRHGAMLLRSPVTLICLFLIISGVGALHFADLYIWNDFPLLMDLDRGVFVGVDAVIGLTVIRPLHLWLLSTRFPRFWIVGIASVLFFLCIYSIPDTLNGF